MVNKINWWKNIQLNKIIVCKKEVHYKSTIPKE